MRISGDVDQVHAHVDEGADGGGGGGGVHGLRQRVPHAVGGHLHLIVVLSR